VGKPKATAVEETPSAQPKIIRQQPTRQTRSKRTGSKKS
jgi:YidC/Oxa1 family membrane protein insertase